MPPDLHSRPQGGTRGPRPAQAPDAEVDLQGLADGRRLSHLGQQQMGNGGLWNHPGPQLSFSAIPHCPEPVSPALKGARYLTL